MPAQTTKVTPTHITTPTDRSRARSSFHHVSALAAVFVLSIIVESEAAHAQRNSVTRNLSADQQYQVRGQGCTIRATIASPERYVFRCPGNKTSNLSVVVGVNRAILRAQQRAIIRASSCMLTPFSSGPRAVTLRCVSLTPTPTPTVPSTPTATPTATTKADANALLRGNIVRAFDSTRPDAVSNALPVTGLAAGDELVSIDRRPQNGMLYALGYNSGAGTVQLYAISSQTGSAVAIGTSGMFVDGSGTPLRAGDDSSTTFSIDFNPTVDRLRVVASNGQNFRMNPNTGAFIDGDSGVSGTQRDGNINGLTATIQQVAYTNNAQDATSTTLYTIDQVTGQLYIQNPANAGSQTLGVTIRGPFTAVSAFDIAPGVEVGAPNTPAIGNGFAVIKQSGSSSDVFANINLTTGELSGLTVMGPNVAGVVGISVLKPAAVPMMALSATGTELVRFRSNAPGTIAAVAITGISVGETLVGIDYRPSTGQLMGLGVNDTTNAGTLYLLDPQTGSAAAVGTPGAIGFVAADGTTPVDLPPASIGYGFDFNPTVDRLRVIAGNGLNFRVNPVSGTAVDGDTVSAGTQTDSGLNGSSPIGNGTAYTNSFGGTTITTQYTLDSDTSTLYIQNPPNSGLLTFPRPVTVGNITLDFSAVGGFDIGADVRATVSNNAPDSGVGYAILTVGSVTSLYTIDLRTGVATLVGPIGSGTTAFAGLALGTTTIE